MASIKLVLRGDTGIMASDPNRNMNLDSEHPYGATGAYLGDWSRDSKAAYMCFEIPDILKQPHIRVKSITFSAVKKYCKVSVWNNQYSRWTNTNVTEMVMDLILMYSNTDAIGSMTWNNNPYSGAETIAHVPVKVNSVAADSRFWYTYQFPEQLSIANYSFLVAKLEGTTESGYYTGCIAGGSTEEIEIEYEDIRPKVNISSYPNKLNSVNPAEIRWSFSSPSGLPQNAIQFAYRLDNVGDWTFLDYTETGYQYYSIKGDTFPAGNVYLSMCANDTSMVASEWTEPVKIEVYNPIPKVSFTNWTITSFNNAASLPVNWSVSSESGFTQERYLLQWNVNGGAWNDISGTQEQFYTFDPKTIPAGRINFRIKVWDSHGFESEWAQVSFTSYDQKPVVTIGYPNDVVINNQNDVIFTWYFYEEVMRGQSEFELRWTSDNGATWHTVSEGSSEQLWKFSAGTFPTGIIIWEIQVTDTDCESSEWVRASFESSGATDAPQITDVSNSPIPTITWMADSQDCFEIVIKSEGKKIYESLLQSGHNVRSFTCNVMLDNGVYVAEMRVLNEYGIYTAWSSYSWILNLPKPEAPRDIFAFIEHNFAVSVDGTVPSGNAAYVVRKESDDSEAVILGRYIGNTFYDFKTALNKDYRYSLRTLNLDGTAGYSDGNWVSAKISEDGAVIHDTRDMSRFVYLFASNSMWSVKTVDNGTKSFVKCIGRQHPVVERMEWIDSTRTITAWVSDEDYEKLTDMSINASVYYRGNGESWKADMAIAQVEEYVNGGQIVTVTLTRLDDDEEVKLL